MKIRWATTASAAVAALLISWTAAGGAEAPSDPLASPVSLVDAVRYAVTQSHDIRIAASAVAVARQQKVRAEAGWYPRVDASGEFVSYSNPPGALIQGIEIPTSDKNVGRGRVTAEQTLYDFGRTRARVTQAEAAVEGAGSRAALTRENLAIDAASAFLAARRADEIRRVSEETLTTARAHREISGHLYDEGAVAKNDVLAADVQVAVAESALISAENQVELSRSLLALRMGFPGDRAAVPAPGPFPVPEAPLPSLGEDLKAALERRQEIKVLEAAIREGEAAVTAAEAAFAPTFQGQGSYSYESNSFNPNPNMFSILVGGRLNLFSGFADVAGVREARVALERRKEELAQQRDRIALDVKSAHLSVIDAEKRRVVAEAAIARADENLRIQDYRYREGIAISTEVLDAQTSLSRAKVDFQNASHDIFEARFRLLQARGELIDFFASLPGAEKP